mgnify:CR=1 FL=1
MKLKIDMHIHTKYSYDSQNDIEEIIKVAKQKGLDGVGLVDHDTTSGYSEMIRLGKEKGIVVVPGVEIRVRGGYLLAYGNVTEVPPKGITPESALSILRKQDVLIAAVHPFKNGLGLKNHIYDLKLDALETANGGAIFGDKPTEKAAKRLGLPKIGGSDAHFLGEIGSVIVTIETPNNSTNDILEAIKRGNTTITQDKSVLRIISFYIKKGFMKLNGRFHIEK